MIKLIAMPLADVPLVGDLVISALPSPVIPGDPVWSKIIPTVAAIALLRIHLWPEETA